MCAMEKVRASCTSARLYELSNVENSNNEWNEESTVIIHQNDERIKKNENRNCINDFLWCEVWYKSYFIPWNSVCVIMFYCNRWKYKQNKVRCGVCILPLHCCCTLLFIKYNGAGMQISLQPTMHWHSRVHIFTYVYFTGTGNRANVYCILCGYHHTYLSHFYALWSVSKR